MDISYVKCDPTGNITGLIQSPVEEFLRPYAASRLFAAEPDMEQLGFVSTHPAADIRLDMSGGEFCGNASLSAAAYYLRLNNMSGGSVSLSVSGSEALLRAEMRLMEDGSYSGTLEMPLPLSISECSLPSPGGSIDLPLVSFPGISHLIAPSDMSPRRAEDLIRPWCEALGAEALGIMLYDSAESSMRPLVWVPGVNTLCWERSCASGTSALGAWLALGGGNARLELKQPGGRLGIEALSSRGRLSSLRLRGQVRMDDAKTLEII